VFIIFIEKIIYKTQKIAIGGKNIHPISHQIPKNNNSTIAIFFISLYKKIILYFENK